MKKKVWKNRNFYTVKFNLNFALISALIISLLIAIFPLYVRADSFKRDFSVVWGGPYNENIYAMESASEDIFYVAGEISNFSYHRIFLERLDVSDRSSSPFEWSYLDERTTYFGDMILDSSENIYIAGTVHNVDYDILLLKFSDQGVLEWNITWGTSGDEIYEAMLYEHITGKCLAIDSMNNVYVAGIMDETTGVLIKFNNLGEYEWNRSWTISLWEDMKIDSSDNIYICGDGIGGFNILKVNPQGDLLWSTSLYPSLSLYRAHLLINSNGLYFCASDYETFLAKFDPDTGNQIWNSSNPIKGVYWGLPLLRIESDSSGNIIFLYQFAGHLGSFNYLGEFQWNYTMGVIPKDLYIDNEDNIYVLSSHSIHGIYIYKFNSIGERLYYYCWGEPPDDPFLPIPAAFYVDSSNEFYVCGTTLIEGEDDYNNFFIIFSPTKETPEIPFNLGTVILITLSTIGILFIRRKRKLS